MHVIFVALFYQHFMSCRLHSVQNNKAALNYRKHKGNSSDGFKHKACISTSDGSNPTRLLVNLMNTRH